MEKRKLILDGYDTAADGLWTLNACVLTKGEQVQTFLDVPGRYAPLDMTDYLTDGQPYYGSASLDATLESSEGDRDERQARIDEMVNALDGYTVTIIHPDHPNHYLTGRVQIYPQYNDMAHAAVQIKAVCEPWLYKAEETVVQKTASTTEQSVWISNPGRLAVVPTVVITGTVMLTYGAYSWTLTDGEHLLPDLYLTPGEHQVTYKGDGTVTFTYREAVLAA